MKRFALILVFPAIVLAVLFTPATACIHPPDGFEAYVDSGAQRGLVFWDNGREVLIMQPAYTVATFELKESAYTAEGTLKDFDSFAWLMPVPSLPDHYAQVEPDVFSDLDKFTEVLPRLPESEAVEDEGPTLGGIEEDGIEFFATVEIGDYVIQPIKAKGDLGGKELAAWLTDNDFGEVDERVMRYYLAEDFYWLAIKLVEKGGLPPDATLNPLQVSFKTPRPVYPIKINDKRGEFDLELWVVTRDRIDLTKSKNFGLLTPEQINDLKYQKNRETAYVNLPETLRAIADPVDDLKQLRIGKVFLHRFVGNQYEEEGGIDLGLMQDDLYFEFEKDVAPKPKIEVKPEVEEEGEGEEDGKDGMEDGDKPDDEKPPEEE